MDEPVCFVPTGENRAPRPGEFYLHASTDNMIQREIYGAAHFNRSIYRRLEPGWWKRAESKLVAVVEKWWSEGMNKRPLVFDAVRADLSAALFPPSEPEPEMVDYEIAVALVKCYCREVDNDNRPWCPGCTERARKVAKARRAREEQP